MDGVILHWSWPPVSTVVVDNVTPGVYRLTNHSSLSGEIADHPNLARGAEYEWDETKVAEENDSGSD
jgi:hypothetical protein